ncbi:MAG TPA: response regulator [Spirochaetota bacterium]|nr:response regulator [Spirochaetota bacterium]
MKEILVIDDDNFVLESIKKQLKEEDMEVMFVDNPLTGLSIIDNKHFDLVLCDIKMEPMNGIEVLRNIKEKHPEVPVIILTGYVDDGLLEKAKDYGSSDFLIKPIRKRELIDSMYSVMTQ